MTLIFLAVSGCTVESCLDRKYSDLGEAIKSESLFENPGTHPAILKQFTNVYHLSFPYDLTSAPDYSFVCSICDSLGEYLTESYQIASFAEEGSYKSDHIFVNARILKDSAGNHQIFNEEISIQSGDSYYMMNRRSDLNPILAQNIRLKNFNCLKRIAIAELEVDAVLDPYVTEKHRRLIRLDTGSKYLQKRRLQDGSPKLHVRGSIKIAITPPFIRSSRRDRAARKSAYARNLLRLSSETCGPDFQDELEKDIDKFIEAQETPVP